MGTYFSSLKSSSSSSSSSNGIEKKPTLVVPTTNSNLIANIDSTKSKKEIAKDKKKLAKFLKMSVVLPATVKQTASVIFLHGLGDTGYFFLIQAKNVLSQI